MQTHNPVMLLWVPNQHSRLRPCLLLDASQLTAPYASTTQAFRLLNFLIAQYPDVDLFHTNVRFFFIIVYGPAEVTSRCL